MSRQEIQRLAAKSESKQVIVGAGTRQGDRIMLQDGSVQMVAYDDHAIVIQLSTWDPQITTVGGLRCGMNYEDIVRMVGVPAVRYQSKWGTQFEVQPGCWVGFDSRDPEEDHSPITYVFVGRVPG